MSDYNQNIPMLPPYRVNCVVSILSETVDYNHKLMNIPAMWKDTMGEGVKVVVLDTGLPVHNDIAVKGAKSFVPGYLEDRNGHGCVSPDTLVHTNFCGVETIARLYDRVGVPEQDMLFPDGFKSKAKDVRAMGLKTYSLNEKTGKAVVARVEFLHRTPVSGEVVSVVLEGGVSYRLTPWHEVCVLVHRHHDVHDVKRKRADELSGGDRMIFATGDVAGNLVSEPYRVEGSLYRQCANCGHVLVSYKKRTARCQCKKCGKSRWDERKRTYFVTEDMAYLVGMVVTDGHVVDGVRKRVEISSKDKDILEGVVGASNRLGFGGGIDEPKGRCGRVLIDSKELVSVMVSLGVRVKRKSYEQEMPEFVGKSPRSVVAAFVAGVIDGGGCVSKENTKNRITTVSKGFAFQMAALLNSMGVSCGVQDYGRSGGFGREKGTGANVYNCTFSAVPFDVAMAMRCERKKVRALLAVEGQRKERRIVSVGVEKYDGFFYDFTVKDHHTYLGNGHFVSNTHVAGIIGGISGNNMGIAGISPNCELYCGAVLGEDGSGTIDGIIDGIKWAVEEVGAKVINMSLGISAGMPNFPKLEEACIEAEKAGVVVVAAAGNENAGVGQPGRYDSVISVAAVDAGKKRASFSDYGPEVDFAAGGVDVYSCWLNNGYAKLSGTSMASPAMAGVVTLIMADEFKDTGKWLTKAEVYAKLQKIAYNVSGHTFDEYDGWGIPMFGNNGSPDPKPELVEPVERCLGFPMTKHFLDAAVEALKAGRTTEEAIGEGFKASQAYIARVAGLGGRGM